MSAGSTLCFSFSETIDSCSILEHPHVAHTHAVVIPWTMKTYSKSVLGSGVDLSWISFDNVLARFIEDIQLLSWNAKSKTYTTQRLTQRRWVQFHSSYLSISWWITRTRVENCIAVTILSNCTWVYVLFLYESDSNIATIIEWPVEFACDLIHQFILQVILTHCLSVNRCLLKDTTSLFHSTYLKLTTTSIISLNKCPVEQLSWFKIKGK